MRGAVSDHAPTVDVRPLPRRELLSLDPGKGAGRGASRHLSEQTPPGGAGRFTKANTVHGSEPRLARRPGETLGSGFKLIARAFHVPIERPQRKWTRRYDKLQVLALPSK